MRLSQLKYFVKTVECLSINCAAKELNISQPAVTAAIKDLEEELSVKLFHREKQRITPTKEGMYFYSRIIKVLADIDDAVTQVSIMSFTRHTISVGVPPMIGSFLIPVIIDRFQKLHPEINVRIVEFKTETIKHMLMDNLLDFIIVQLREDYVYGLDYIQIMKTYYNLYVSPENPLAKKDVAGFDDIKKEPFIVFDRILFKNRDLASAFKENNLTPNIRLTTGQISTIKNYVRRNLASTFLMESCVNEQDGLVKVKTEFDTGTTLVLAHAKGKVLDSDQVKFAKFIQKIKKR